MRWIFYLQEIKKENKVSYVIVYKKKYKIKGKEKR